MSKAKVQTDPFDSIDLHAADVILGNPEGEGYAAGSDADTGADPGDATAAVATPVPAATPAQPTAQTLAELEAPKIWPQAARDAWKALHGAPDVRPHLEQVHGVLGQTQAYVTQIEQQNALYRNQFEPIGKVLAPYAQQWAQEGMDVQQGLRQIMTFRDSLLSNPQETLLQLATMLGVDLAQATAEAPYVDPVVAQLQQRIAEQDQRWQQAEQQQKEQKQQQLLSDVQAFETETDAQGNPKHPHFREVLNDMLALTNMGRASNPEEAYKLAVQLNPALQQQAAAAAAAQKVAQVQAQNAQVAQTVAKSGLPRTRPDRGSSGDKESLDSIIADELAKSHS